MDRKYSLTSKPLPWTHKSNELKLDLHNFTDALPLMAQLLSQSPTTCRAILITGPVEHHHDPPIEAASSHLCKVSVRRLHQYLATLWGHRSARPPVSVSPRQNQTDSEPAHLVSHTTPAHGQVAEGHSGQCGYRGMQMMLSYLLARNLVKLSLLPDGPFSLQGVPDVSTLRSYLGRAWMNGINTDQAPPPNVYGKLVAPMGWVGTPEV